MAKFMDGAVVAGKGLATGAPVAVVTDVALDQFPSLSATQRELVRFGAGVGVSALALLLGAPADWSAGPAIANGGVAAVGGARSYGLSQKIRDMLRGTSSAGIRR